MVSAGNKISHYKVVSALGVGGMGEVFLAQDTRLNRQVAIKILNDAQGKDDDILRRFKQEARAASALNHPNIVTIYEIGELNEAQHFIAMEFVEGETLRQLLKTKKLTLEDALEIAVQTASALSAAHAAGIVHRDIKPENIMRRPDGLVKVLDFGLAKQTIIASELSYVDPEAPTQEYHITTPGMIMGTAAYMSPEQARGKETDARTDIWSLGIVMYEMIAGRVPFTGETKSDMLAAILKTETPLLSIHTPNIPHELEHIIKKTLGKNREERYHVVKDLLLDLKIFQSELTTSIHPLKSNSSLTGSFSKPALTNITSDAEHLPNKRRRLWFAVPALVFLIGLAVWYWRQNPRSTEINPASLASSQITSWKSDLGEDSSSRARFSPDGKLIAFVAAKNGKNSIWLKQIGGGEPFTRKQDDATETSPIWSPDGGNIAYFSDRGGRKGIWMTPALGGSATLLMPIDARGQLILWSKDGATVYFEMQQNLYALALAAKQITKLTNFDESQAVRRDFSVSPDERQIIYADKKDGQKDLWKADLHGANPTRLTGDADEDGKPVWHPDGRRVIYNSNRNGVKQIRLAFLDGRPNVQMTFSDSDSDVSDVSADGSKILYQSTKDDLDLWGVNLDDKKEIQLTSDIGVEFWQDAAPNGETIVYQAARRSSVGDKLFNCLIMAQKTNGDNRRIQLAPDGFSPHWSPDGNQVAFLRLTDGKINLWLTSATGGDERVLTSDGVFFAGFSTLPFNRFQIRDYQWSPDSRSLIYCANRAGFSNIRQTAIDGAGESQLTNNEDKNLRFFNPIFSPDGKRLVWKAMSTDNQSKKHWSIWMSADGKVNQIYQSDSVVQTVGWSPSGNELILKAIKSDNEAQTLPIDVNILQIALEGGTPRLISTLKEVYFLNIQLSPDRETLAFVARKDNNDVIQTFPSTGGMAKTVIGSSDNRVYFSSLTFAPDGKTIYYGKQANWQVISMIENFK